MILFNFLQRLEQLNDFALLKSSASTFPLKIDGWSSPQTNHLELSLSIVNRSLMVRQSLQFFYDTTFFLQFVFRSKFIRKLVIWVKYKLTLFVCAYFFLISFSVVEFCSRRSKAWILTGSCANKCCSNR